MDINRLSPFLGKPIIFNGVEIHSPTVESVEKIGEIEYNIKYLLSTFDKENILLRLFGVSEDDLDEISDENNFKVLTEQTEVAVYIAEAISFFVKGVVKYNQFPRVFSFLRHDGYLVENFISMDNYESFVEIIHILNGNEKEVKQPLTFKSERAKKMYREMEKHRRKKSKGNSNSLELKDILSLLCSDEGNGISIFNVHTLTLYQVYEQFERLGIKNNRKTILPVWANGYLKEGEKLPDIITKTKL